MVAGYAKSGIRQASAYVGWNRYNTAPYQSATHGGRYVNNYANRKARHYGRFEKVGRLPKGAFLAKDSFSVTADGRVAPGPLFTMEKMKKGFRKDSGDWRYTMILPNGTVFGTTNGTGSKNVEFCIECHAAMKAQDSLFFMPEEYRVTRK